ncbi:tetratricopeptide repeat protein [Thermoflexibacter ruber]|nr:tetratricopeptide repeat protein [Thermoflexibacter ruber]
MSSEAFYQQGLNYLHQRKYELALQSFEKALKEQTYNATIISDKAVTLFHLNRKLEALELLDQAQNLEPNNPYRYSSRAFIKEALGDLAGAIEDYQKAIALDPEDMVAYNNLGLLEEKLGYKQAAEQKFKQADDLVEKYGFAFGLEEKQEEKTQKIENQGVEKAKAKKASNKFSLSYFLSISKQVFSSKEVFQEFVSFVLKKKK